MPIDDPDLKYRVRVFNISNDDERAEFEEVINRDDVTSQKTESSFDANGNYMMALHWLEPKSETIKPIKTKAKKDE